MEKEGAREEETRMQMERDAKWCRAHDIDGSWGKRKQESMWGRRRGWQRGRYVLHRHRQTPGLDCTYVCT